MIKKYIFMILLPMTLLAAPKTIIWDLGGIFLNVSRSYYIMHGLGVRTIASYALHDWKLPTNLEKIMFDVLAGIEIPGQNEYSGARTATGFPLPSIYCAYMAGKVSGQEVLQLVSPHLESLMGKNYFISSREKELVKAALEALFNPIFQVQATSVVEENFELLRELKNYSNESSEKIRLIALTNLDPQSFQGLQELYPAHLSLFDKIYCSGMLGVIKPDVNAYAAVLKSEGSKPSECIFIDDQIENVQAAQALGMPSIHYKNPYSLRITLQQLGFLKERSLSVTKKFVAFSCFALVIGSLSYSNGFFSK